ncbi:MAG: DUF87 domain-containing protein [Symploca sp. SIO1C4]|uniref:DUF87 domain-containing protein n=1 Tax=Symploca sp. SIO1C4 TaxID=2607765 RepID=A0A6B3NHR1_9CYAN|nr:DUF87 domain-containing protein [Symploca sp. SIO1C4]
MYTNPYALGQYQRQPAGAYGVLNSAYGQGLVSSLPPEVAFLYDAILEEWEYSTAEQILSDCRQNLDKRLYTYAQLIVSHLEQNSQPSASEVEAYKLTVRKLFRKSPTPETFRKLAAETENVYLQQIALNAVQTLENAAVMGRLPGKFAKNIRILNPIEVILREQVSALIFGNTGSGKSSLASMLVSVLSRHLQKPVQVLVLDPHLNDWGCLPIVDEKVHIIRVLTLLVHELEARKANWRWQVRNLPKEQRQKDWPFLITIWDEIDDTLSFANSKAGQRLIEREGLMHPSDVLRVYGSQIRKFGGMLLGLNQSGNVEALGIDSKYRSNYIDIHLVESALMQAESLWKMETPERAFIEARRDGYPCVVRSRPAIHPTHGHYPLRQEGLAPAASPAPLLEPWGLSLTIEPVVFSGNIEEVFGGQIVGSKELALMLQGPKPSQALPQGAEQLEPDPWEEGTPGLPTLEEAFRQIKAGRSQTPPLKKSDICATWGGRNADKFAIYDEALQTYGQEWLKEFIADGKLTKPWQEIVELFGGIPYASKDKSSKNRSKFNQTKELVFGILHALGVEPEAASSKMPPANVIPLRRHPSA